MKNTTAQMAKERRRQTEMRNRELLRDYRKELKAAFESASQINRMEIIKKVLTTNQPRYYINFDHAYNVIMHINSKSEVSKKSKLKQIMWLEIYHKVKEQQAKHPSLSLSSALARVLNNERASRYFISEKYAYKYLYKVCHQGGNATVAV